ncbi:MAG: hypothetical protein ACQESE_03850 [Nanobdellota archaeon]
MVRITVDTAQDNASTIRSIIFLLNQELSKKGEEPIAQQNPDYLSPNPDRTAAQPFPDSRTAAQQNSDFRSQYSDHSRAAQQSPEPSRAAQPSPDSSYSTSPGGAFQHQDTSSFMDMFSDDMPSTDPKTYETHNDASNPASRYRQVDDSDDFLFGNVEDVASDDNRTLKDLDSGLSRPRPRSYGAEEDDDDVDVTEYH